MIILYQMQEQIHTMESVWADFRFITVLRIAALL